MPIRLEGISLSLRRAEHALLGRAADRLGIKADQVADLRIVRRAVDARRRPNIFFIYTVEVTLADPSLEGELIARFADAGVHPVTTEEREPILPGERPLAHRPIIVGTGPAGLFAGLLLAEHGYRPLLIERGRCVDERAADHARFLTTRTPEADSNLLFGEGGAGTWSDGKLHTRIRSRWIEYVLERFIAVGAPADLAADARPHLGTDVLGLIIPKLRQRIETLGGEVRFNCRLDSLERTGDAVTLTTTTGNLRADCLLLAIGASARDTFAMLVDAGVRIEPRPFQMGLRIEHPQKRIDRAQYGSAAGHPRLPAAEYQLVHRAREYPVHSFCMCPGGVIVPTVSEPGRLALNGMSSRARDGKSGNSALVWTARPDSTEPLAGVELQRRTEERAFELGGSDYTAPAQRVSDFIRHRASTGTLQTSFALGTKATDLARLLAPEHVKALIHALRDFGKRLRGFDGPDGILLAPETRASCPVRILRDPESRQSVTFPGLYPVGEGAGYAGGITSAACDGLTTAESIISTFAPLDPGGC